ncbi:transposase [Polaromonas sp. P1-6]|nr:transposase [Polaromonas sp. P1-6]
MLDNLNTHFKKCFDDVLGKREATKLLRRVQFHYTPKHASWLNMAKIEIGILSRQWLNRRIESRQSLRSEVSVWQQARKRSAANHRVEIHSAGCRSEDGPPLCFETCVLMY